MIGFSRSSPRRKAERILYYLRNIARDATPQRFFRDHLVAILQSPAHDPADISQRLNYYNKLTVGATLPTDAPTIQSWLRRYSIYDYDLKEHARYFSPELRIGAIMGDVNYIAPAPSIVKSRPAGDRNANSVLFNLDKFRHFYFPRDPIPFEDKLPTAIWRGAAYTPARKALLANAKDFPRVDLGNTAKNIPPSEQKPFMTREAQLRHRYVISVEGNDVATNLKWIMNSNSLCLTPMPRIETWFMEGILKPGVHFVKIADDFADIEDKIDYYERHPHEAREIIRNAQAHVTQFQDSRREQQISLLVLYKYFLATQQTDRIAGLPFV